MTVLSSPGTGEKSGFIPRQRDRRAAFGGLLSALTQALGERHDVSLMRGLFEQTMRRMLPIRTLQLRDRNSRWVSRPGPDAGIESIAIEVPGRPSGGIIEATFDPGCGLGEWDFQLLGLAAHVAGFVLEIERARIQLSRAGLGPPVKPRRESAVPLIGSTPAMQILRNRIERVADTDFTLLLEGESGVGKELVARLIHDSSVRRNGPFVAVNCAALVETLVEAELFGIEERTATGVRGRRGKFEQADGGTLFLDEVSDLSATAQAKLLRALQDLAIERVGGQGAHRVDVRIVAATNRGLAGLVQRNQFRADLFYRLSGVDIRVPTLRERRDDILELARHFLERHKAKRPLRLSAAAADALVAHDWPGNVRELERLIERAVALASTEVIELEDLPEPIWRDLAAIAMPSIEARDTMRAWASRYARLMVERCGGRRSEAARVLGISYHTLKGHLKYPSRAAMPARREDEEENEAPTIPDVCVES
jgi:DNA-binding NtrC family response regulator